MRVAYVGTPDDEATTEVALFGLVFPKDEPVDVSDLHPDHQALLDGNPTFVTEGAETDVPDDEPEAHAKPRRGHAKPKAE